MECPRGRSFRSLDGSRYPHDRVCRWIVYYTYPLVYLRIHQILSYLVSCGWVLHLRRGPRSLRITSSWVKGCLNSIWKHFSLLIQMTSHLEDTKREISPCMSHQHLWCVIVWSSERVSQVCWMWPKVWIGRTLCGESSFRYPQRFQGSLSSLIGWWYHQNQAF